MDNGKRVEVSDIVTDDRVALAILANVAKGQRERVEVTLDGLDELVPRLAVEAFAVRHVNQFAQRPGLRPGTFKDFERVTSRIVGTGGSWNLQDKPLWKAADWALASLHFRRSRRVVLVVTDGLTWTLLPDVSDDVGTERSVSFGDFKRRVQQEYATVFVVGIDGAEISKDLREVARESGGDVRSIAEGEDIRPGLFAVAKQISDQVVLYFKPTQADGREHRIQVRVKAGAMPVIGPGSYVAPRPAR